MQFSVRVLGRMSGDVVAQRTADALGIFNSTPQFLSNERWEIEVVLPDEAEDAVESGPDGEIAPLWELLCDSVGDNGLDVDAAAGAAEEAATADLERVRQALLDAGATEVLIETLEP
ncbi:hypothetical protein ABT034_07850 [Streptomyces sp. NPDC002773]|uniref:hypothetical protein n=1 Tax=Streptomyces sp. NPDC002773 TaxID=3154430 RepID=UPI003319C3E4